MSRTALGLMPNMRETSTLRPENACIGNTDGCDPGLMRRNLNMAAAVSEVRMVRFRTPISSLFLSKYAELVMSVTLQCKTFELDAMLGIELAVILGDTFR